MSVSGREGEVDALMRARRSHPNGRVRQRAQALSLLFQGHRIMDVARMLHHGPHNLRVWRRRFLRDGIEGLADHPRVGRPPKLTCRNLKLLEEALAQGPQAYGLVITVWTVRDLGMLLCQEHQVRVSTSTVHRALKRLGYRYRRPRHDLTHRQDPEAVASAKGVLDWLKKTVPDAVEGFAWSSLTSARSTSTLGWRRSGKRRVGL